MSARTTNTCIKTNDLDHYLKKNTKTPDRSGGDTTSPECVSVDVAFP